MRRALALIACLSLLSCDQPADLVGYTIAPRDTGGAGGMGSAGAGSSATGGGAGSGGASTSTGGASASTGGMGGMGQTGGREAEDDSTCDREAASVLALVRLTSIVSNDCVFGPRDYVLITQTLLELPPVSDPEAVPFDLQCSNINIRVRPVNVDATPWKLCPAYCEALKRRLLDQESALEGCLPDAGI